MFEKYAGPASIICLLFGALMLFLGGRFSLPFASNLGIVCFGFMFGVQGAQMIASQSEAAPSNSHQRLTMWAGRIYGGMFFAIGGLILLAAAANFFLPGGMQGYMDRMLSRPFGWGLLLGVAGGFGVAYGMTILFGAANQQWKGCSAIFENLRQWFFGLLFLIGGFILGMVGLGLILAPNFMASLGQLFVQILNLLLS
jgi:hypothetical protein